MVYDLRKTKSLFLLIQFTQLKFIIFSKAWWYLRVTELGLNREWRPDNNQDTSGTPGYMAPEVMCRQNHSYEVDYLAMGVIIYEFMLGKRPSYGWNRKEIRDQMLQKQV